MAIVSGHRETYLRTRGQCLSTELQLSPTHHVYMMMEVGPYGYGEEGFSPKRANHELQVLRKGVRALLIGEGF